ncbi:AraC family transcriptional regulator [Pedobacter africanus]|uniref:AraC-type DNA-binding protein n=1 Tax=Pedobacter africanus TaxID=151894 RepID=A0A1W2DW61_9SPHI|nr:AraC family transcriptional regulator [Pedobacter africanus]SMD01673.1 AraC-type DNA-binding protein [Pedobacter africanus]
MIRATPEIVQPASEQSFLLRAFGDEAFKAPYHFHVEYELTLILSGKGKRYIGNHMADFKAGDMVLVGANLPHCWKLVPEKQSDAKAIVIQFTADFLGEHFFDKPENAAIRSMFQKAVNGIWFDTECFAKVYAAILEMQQQDSFNTLISFLKILYQLSQSPKVVLLDKEPEVVRLSLVEQKRINPVLAYLVDNFRKQVSLNEAAALTNMTTNAFCKYFKKMTRKTFMEMVIQYRLNYATQQLIETDKPVSDIAFSSGFTDVSHFYKVFKSKMGLSPLGYRKKFMVAY